MLNNRVIPSLLLNDGGLVKGVKFKNHKYVGDPINVVKIFNDKEVDELVIFDIAATKNDLPPDLGLLADIASEAFMPLAYGGGLRSAHGIESLFKIGIEKAIFNTFACKNLQLITDASSVAGSQSIVVSIDVRKNFLGQHTVYSHAGAFNTGLNPIDFAKQAEEAGAGEIIITSIDKEGTGTGYDLSLIKKITSVVEIPVIASGGASCLSDFKQAIDSGASAVSAGNMFVFHGKHKAVLVTYPEYESLMNLFRSE